MTLLHKFVFGIYPYIGLSIFLLGSLIRFDREQYSWKSDSSQFLRRGQLRLGNILFHVGILLLFLGHFVGLLTPKDVYHALGLSSPNKQMLSMVAGGIAGTMCLVGMAILIYRRASDARIRAVTTGMDLVLLSWILVTLLIGLTSIVYSLEHLDGSVMILLATWAQHIMTFQSDASDYLAAVPVIYRLHLFFGMSLFVLLPFSRLVHAWSGFGSVLYLGRSYQLMRGR